MTKIPNSTNDTNFLPLKDIYPLQKSNSKTRPSSKFPNHLSIP
eukprot:CAMPEP_0197016570 /NCGR_PEP_ID=MMETSP1380-20130617/78838_1 /TAXON_ID=5936 /ORGANISM="Euplotes crassus, Strain CT5" /LENGTH=42 /DNA_ID= /DNA_START= /DNA_END= /DNA_ORIENTATION=